MQQARDKRRACRLIADMPPSGRPIDKVVVRITALAAPGGVTLIGRCGPGRSSARSPIRRPARDAASVSCGFLPISLIRKAPPVLREVRRLRYFAGVVPALRSHSDSANSRLREFQTSGQRGLPRTTGGGPEIAKALAPESRYLRRVQDDFSVACQPAACRRCGNQRTSGPIRILNEKGFPAY